MTGIHKTQSEIILAILPTDRRKAITSKDIFDSLESADKGRLGSASNVSKALEQLNRRGGIANGNSEIVNGKTRLTWYKLENTEHVPKAKDDLAKVQPMADQTQIDTVDDGQAVEIPPGEKTTNADDEQLAATSNEILKENAIETLARDGYMILDPLSEAEQFICEVVQRLKWAEQPRPQPVQIERKGMKIKALTLIADSTLIQPDIAEFLKEIANDLQKIEEK